MSGVGGGVSGGGGEGRGWGAAGRYSKTEQNTEYACMLSAGDPEEHGI